MVEILLVTHGGLAEGLLSSLAMVAGNTDCCCSLSLHEGDAPEVFAEKLTKTVQSLCTKEVDGLLVLVDLLGGTPFNSVFRLLRDLKGDDVRCIAGVNFPMLIEAVFNCERSDLDELERMCLEAAHAGIVSCSELMNVKQ
ncbi:hypothetical protein K6V98_01635 [Collinsella sp. AGMB00827]|uniref:PTS EIIA type-4 domain-containing protein n=1 Tax=Collinsella ureilytica TaxID=2869515 RepID=A0ABS7MJ01_9ACTN|nr:hypothetical protein [Collinsella urealyticum]MBY4797065.1 hypothetical protein [Collinsella urealyticum]